MAVMLARIAAGAACGLAVTRLAQYLVDRQPTAQETAGSMLVRAQSGKPFPNSPAGAARAAARAVPSLNISTPRRTTSCAADATVADAASASANAEQTRRDVLHHALRVPYP